MPAERSRRAVLIAEDNEISRDILMHQLGLLDCQVVACADGGRAAEAWRGGGFSLLLTDLQMPGLDGFELASVIRAEERSGRMPIVALTAGSSLAEVERCHAAGIDECLTKPASLAALRGALQRWLAPGPASPRPTEVAP